MHAYALCIAFLVEIVFFLVFSFGLILTVVISVHSRLPIAKFEVAWSQIFEFFIIKLRGLNILMIDKFCSVGTWVDVVNPQTSAKGYISLLKVHVGELLIRIRRQLYLLGPLPLLGSHWSWFPYPYLSKLKMSSSLIHLTIMNFLEIKFKFYFKNLNFIMKKPKFPTKEPH